MMACRVILFTIILFLSGLGISRLRFETELTNILPETISQVAAVKSFHQYFADDHQMVVLLRCSEDKVYEEDTQDLGQYLEDNIPDSEAITGSIYEENADLFAKEVAYTWALSRPEIVSNLEEKIATPATLRNDLTLLKRDIQHSFNSGTTIQHSYDPLGLMRHPGLRELAKAEYSFESDDGKSRFFFHKRTGALKEGYQEDALWVASVRAHIEQWIKENDDIFTYGLTGGPIYNAEVGAGMEKDIFSTVGITLSLIALLFLSMQRSLKQLVLLISLVSVTFFITLGVAGLIMPHLNLLSIAFAAILLGLIIDYLVVLLRESRHFPNDRRVIRRGLMKSILWAALTTALVFSVLLLSSFPGVRQLGGLIVIGLITGAFVMLWGGPIFIEKVGYQQGLILPRKPRKGYQTLAIMFGLLLISGVTFSTKGFPLFSFSLNAIQPKGGEASVIQNELSQGFSSWSDLRTVIFASAETPLALENKLKKALTDAKSLLSKGLLTDIMIPAQMVPYQKGYEENVKTLKRLEKKWTQIASVAQDVGFSEEGLKFDRKVFDTIQSLPNTHQEFTMIERLQPLTKGMIAEHEGTHYFRGNIVLPTPLTEASLSQLSALNTNGVTMTGWGTLSATLQPVVKEDFQKIFIPASLVILLGLGVVFKNVKDTLLVISILGTSLAVVNALMVWLGLSWNFLNSIAIPLIVGMGIDYGIHIIFALRRQGAQQSSIWRGVGLAITFCGLSSVIGFGSLTLANNDLLKSLGHICSLGVLTTMILSLLIIPPTWRTWNTQERH